ncbi:MAG: penicillin-insensitive murein endopeptidase [Albidovulum sp.]
MRVWLLVAILALAASMVQAEQLANKMFGAKRSASSQAPQSIGTYAKGCGGGFAQLPETGPTWQAMRLSRNRNWGHPELVQYVADLSATARNLGWAGLYVGDMSQPRGGPMTSGHSSHQIGLDADIWMLPPKRLNLTRGEREKISSISVRTEDQKRVNGNWTRTHHQLLRAAASDPRVDRIFVAAAVKVEMCKSAKSSDKLWLQKIRPLYGHNTHFHVRLKCPKGSRRCDTQKPTVAVLSKGGDGCDETLNWWVTTYLEKPKTSTKPKKQKKPKGPKKKGARDYTLADLPRQCAAVLASD